MIDFSKIYCKIHPYDLVTNFCWKEECMTGLCATCVCTHTETHLKNSKAPQYQNVRNTFTDMHQKVRKEIQVLQNDKQRITQMARKFQTNRRKMKDVVEQIRNQCLQLVNDHFDRIGKEFHEQITQEDTKVGLHSQYRMDSLSTYLSKQIQNLINAAQQLNSVNFIDCVKRVKKERLVNSHKAHLEVNAELKENQQYRYNLDLNEDSYKDMKVCLQKLLNLSFSYPSSHMLESIVAQKLKEDSSRMFQQEETISKEFINIKDANDKIEQTNSWSQSRQHNGPRMMKNQSQIVGNPFGPGYTRKFMMTEPQGFNKLNNNYSTTMSSFPSKYAIPQPQTPTLCLNNHSITQQFRMERPQTPEIYPRNYSIIIKKPVNFVPNHTSMTYSMRNNNFINLNSNSTLMEHQNGIARNSSAVVIRNQNKQVKILPQRLDMNQNRGYLNVAGKKGTSTKKGGIKLFSSNEGSAAQSEIGKQNKTSRLV